MPLEATQHTPEGAKAFAAFFIKTIDWGYATTSSAYMRHYYTVACTACAGLAKSMETVSAKRHRYVGGRITIKSIRIKPRPFVKAAEDTVSVGFDLAAYEEVDRSGKVVRAEGAQANLSFDASTAWRRNAWAIVSLAVEK